MANTLSRGQVLALFAILLPAVLLPVAALAAETSLIAERQARLSGATALAATTGALALDTGALRASGHWVLAAGAAEPATRRALAAAEPRAVVDAVRVEGDQVTVVAHEPVGLQLAVFGPPTVTVHARATARLTPGFAAPIR